MCIRQEISSWDGKSAKVIRGIYDRNCHKSSFVSEVLRLVKHQTLQKGATWLLKRYLENSGCLEPRAIKEVYQLLPKLEHWETKLLVLQCIPYMPIPKTHKKKVETFLRECLVDDTKFVRAWAYSGLYELAFQYPEYQEETKQLFEMAMREQPASVKARIRKVMKEGF